MSKVSIETPSTHSNDWKSGLRITAQGRYENAIENTLKIMLNDPKLKGTFGFNEFTKTRFQLKPIYFEGFGSMGMLEHDSIFTDKKRIIQSIVKAEYGFKPTLRDVKSAIILSAAHYSSNSVEDLLNRVRGILNNCAGSYDNKARLETVLIRYLGTPDTAYYREVITEVCVGFVARIFNPGCHFDRQMLLSSKAGAGKSEFCRVMGFEDYHTVLPPELFKKYTHGEAMLGKIITEVTGLNSSSEFMSPKIKRFITAKDELVRIGRTKEYVRYPRQSISIGTTTADVRFDGEPGTWRYWPVALGDNIKIDIRSFKEEWPMIVGEAVHEYRKRLKAAGGEPLRFQLKNAEAKAEQDRLTSL